MNATQPSTRPQGSLRVTEWVLGILGAIAVLLGLVILFGGEDQYVGLGGEASWRVGDIAVAWGYGLLVGGAVLVALALALVRRDRRGGAPGPAAPRSSQADVVVHAGVFVVVNAFLWIQDLALGGGLDYAYWITIPWGLGLTAHAIAALANDTRRPAPH